jgi:hypothetical protein
MQNPWPWGRNTLFLFSVLLVAVHVMEITTLPTVYSWLRWCERSNVRARTWGMSPQSWHCPRKVLIQMLLRFIYSHCMFEIDPRFDDGSWCWFVGGLDHFPPRNSGREKLNAGSWALLTGISQMNIWPSSGKASPADVKKDSWYWSPSAFHKKFNRFQHIIQYHSQL